MTPDEEDPSFMMAEQDDALHSAVSEAGLLAYGVLLVEVWIFDQTCLHRIAVWLDPIFHPPDHHLRDESTSQTTTGTSTCPLCRLTQATLPDFVPTKPLAPGEGLPGVLWCDAGAIMSNTSYRSSSVRATTSGRNNYSLEPVFARGRQVAWRQVAAVANDPDQPWNPRLQVLKESGLGWVAAVSFAQTGIVLFMARESVDTDRLKDATNENFLMASTQLIGALYLLQEPRRAAIAARNAQSIRGWHTLKQNIQHLVQAKVNLQAAMSQSPSKGRLQPTPSKTVRRQSSNHSGSGSTTAGGHSINSSATKTANRITRKLHTVVTKMAGANIQPPPVMSWRESLLTFVASGMTMYTLTCVSRHLDETYGSDYAIVLGPLGAFMTLLYGLGAAPASQPRSAMFGQAVSISIGIGIGYVDDWDVSTKQSLAVALAAATMAKLGLTHPPAGAAAMIFASSDSLGWTQFLSLMIGNLVAIGMATAFNNWSNKRQYPSYWGIPTIPKSWKRYQWWRNRSS